MAKVIAVPDEVIINKIYFVRGKKVMLDRDLAELYNVTTGNLNKAVKRNKKRFPDDFMFQLTEDEFKNLIFQNGTSSWGGTRKMPYAFTEQGVAMLSGVLEAPSTQWLTTVRYYDEKGRVIQLISDNISGSRDSNYLPIPCTCSYPAG
ncbi:MAG TPA: ORF6N domain-containing protein [Puia sp.]